MIYFDLLLTFIKVGAFTFGGGYAMLPLIQDEITAHGWLTQEELINFIAVSESTPGSFAVNVSTYVGMETGGLLGAFCATFGVVLPSFVIILVVAKCYEQFQRSKIVKGCMSGLKPAVIGLIAAALISTGKTVFFQKGMAASVFMTVPFITSLLIFIGMLILTMKRVHPILIVVLSGILGIVAGLLYQ